MTECHLRYLSWLTDGVPLTIPELADCDGVSLTIPELADYDGISLTVPELAVCERSITYDT